MLNFWGVFVLLCLTLHLESIILPPVMVVWILLAAELLVQFCTLLVYKQIRSNLISRYNEPAHLCSNSTTQRINLWHILPRFTITKSTKCRFFLHGRMQQKYICSNKGYCDKLKWLWNSTFGSKISRSCRLSHLDSLWRWGFWEGKTRGILDLDAWNLKNLDNVRCKDIIILIWNIWEWKNLDNGKI